MDTQQVSYIDLSIQDVAFAALLILVNGIISICLQLKLERRLLIASVRTVLQLTLIGFVLEWIFQANRWYFVATIMLAMTTIAGFSAVRRTKRRYPGIWINSFVSVFASSWFVTAIALSSIIKPETWCLPQYNIPLLGMILGNTLNGISLGLDRLTSELSEKRSQVEMRLTLGATRWEACRDPMRDAVRTGMVPIVNSMMVVGLVSLPGMMTGQMLAGTLPMGAVRYQIVIMFLIASGTALGTVGVLVLSYRQLFNSRNQFLFHKLRRTE